MDRSDCDAGGIVTVALVCLAAALVILPDLRTRRCRTAGAATPGGATGSGGAPDDPHAVPAAFDLMAACLRAGLPTATAARAVADSAPPALALALRRGADRLELGAAPSDAWSGLGEATADGSDDETEALEAFARAARRSARSGAPLSGIVAEVAERQRERAEDRAAAAVERAGVLVSGPLGLCFLPAFVCLGIVPVVIGLAGRVLGEGLL
ncbi:type II secretion system F family protein [Rhodococcus indonesiensis]|uniref:type II secretion system F family protein n=1 Tax=Rhodococcus indonesiensis TaxID=3055869 RepID=UPI0039F65793